MLSLAEAVGPSPAPFVAQLTCGGLPAGELRGKIWLRFSAGAGGDEDEEGPELGPDDSVLGEPGPAAATSGVTGLAAGGSGSGVAAAAGASGAGVEVVKTGYLLKQGSKVKSWKRRWFVLTAAGELSYFADRKV